MKQETYQHQSWIFADGHVHIYSNFSESSCLEWAMENFDKTAATRNLGARTDRVLFLAESNGYDWFTQQRTLARNNPNALLGKYQRKITDENSSLLFTETSGKCLVVIAGRQIVSSEKLEVLALGLTEAFPDGMPLQQIIAEINDKNCLAVLPWGVGKWLGKRKQILSSLITREPRANVFLADNGNRPFFWPLPEFFNASTLPYSCDLAGSDPLPLQNQEKRIGSYGFCLHGPLDLGHPFHFLREKLINTASSFQTFGDKAEPFSFFFNQIAMRLKRF